MQKINPNATFGVKPPTGGKENKSAKAERGTRSGNKLEMLLNKLGGISASSSNPKVAQQLKTLQEYYDAYNDFPGNREDLALPAGFEEKLQQALAEGMK